MRMAATPILIFQTSFSPENWHSMVDFATVYSIDDIRFTFKNGQEIKS